MKELLQAILCMLHKNLASTKMMYPMYLCHITLFESKFLPEISILTLV